MLTPGQSVPEIDLPLTIKARFELSKQKPDSFTMLVFYRGKHCPICKRYLEELGGKLGKFTDLGVSPFAISMDSEERAMVTHEEWDTHDLPLAYGLPEDQAREWGLFISEKQPDSDVRRAVSRSASAKSRLADLPPSSRATRLTVGAAF